MLSVINVLKLLYKKLPFRFTFVERLYQRYMDLYRNKVVIAKRDGILFELHLNQLIDGRIYFSNRFEPDTIEAINRIVRSGSVAIDIGANVGWHTLHLAKNVGVQGQVFAFEPTDWGFRKLSRNCELNEFGNIHLEKIALSNKTMTTGEYSFRSQWSLDGAQTEEEKGTVSFMTLDDYLDRAEVRHIDFIKLDVDGFEYKILQGASQVIERDRPVIIIELGDTWLRKVGNSIEDVSSLLSRYYDFYNEESYEQIQDINAVIKALPGDATINVICLPHGRTVADLER